MLTSVDETLRVQSSSARLVGRTCRGAGLSAHRQRGEGLFRPVVLLKEQRRFPPNTQGSLLLSHHPEWIAWRPGPKPSAFKGSGPTPSFAVDFVTRLAYPGASGRLSPFPVEILGTTRVLIKSDSCLRLGCVHLPSSPGR